MYTQYSIFAVVFSGQQHLCPEILKLIADLLKTPDHCFRFFGVIKLLSDLDQFRYLFQFRAKPVICAEPVFERLFFFQDFLSVALVVPETRLQALVLKFLYPLSKTRRVKDNLPLPRSARAEQEAGFLFHQAVTSFLLII